ncbi:transcriptional regulator with XRE-family HTH domain [Actimicrobium sp. GrIS 1.19]|nr:transcriptional regulator with XRE-family HTH domain [Actimicrobium sp. GrIS 1.19]
MMSVNPSQQQNFSSRLKESLHRAGYPSDSPTRLAREFNVRFDGRPVTAHAARKWLQGESIPTQERLRALADWLGVSAEWLRFDGEEMHLQPLLGPTFPPDDLKLIESLNQLRPTDRTMAVDLIHLLLDLQQRR